MSQRSVSKSIVVENARATCTLLAFNYHWHDQFEQAGKVGVQVLEVRFRTLGKEYRRTLRSICEWARPYVNTGRLSEAKVLGEQGLK
jgi:hypothetical protein